MSCFSLAILLSFVWALFGCQKEDIGSADCYALRNGLIAKDAGLVNKTLGHLSITYSKDNLEKLAEDISAQCDIAATVLCFECIKTNPPQTEVRFTFSHSGATVERIVDLSYTLDRKIQVVNVHD